jgi:type II secretory pathway pseudopilin PulG
MPAHKVSPWHRGFTYIGLLILVTIISIAATTTIQLGAVAQRRAAEQELLYVGMQLRAALRSYRDSTPEGQPPFPKELGDLLKDARLPGLRRHLRSVPVDPISGESHWGFERTTDGRIIGVHSLSQARPIKVENFEPELAAFEGKETYSQWVFSALPVPPPRTGDAKERQ